MAAISLRNHDAQNRARVEFMIFSNETTVDFFPADAFWNSKICSKKTAGFI